MSTNPKRIPIWGVVSVTLTLGTLLSALLVTGVLDALLEGPGPASVTTRVPGFVYAGATVMKVCLVMGLASAVMALIGRVSAGRAGSAQVAPRQAQGLPLWGFTSVTLAPLAPLVGALALITAQAVARTPDDLSMMDMSRFSRLAVVVMLAVLSTGVMVAATSLVRRERPVLLPAFGLITNALLIGLFWYFAFYAVGFDQDTWAPR